jgi:kinesin family protein 5
MSRSGLSSRKEQSTRQNVRVVCRIRPTNQKEIASGGTTCVKLQGNSVEVNYDGNQNGFSFDRIFGMDSKQMEVFQDTALPLISDVLSGYNATIFAYGQTGTGKVS